jgi:hypothetical protein
LGILLILVALVVQTLVLTYVTRRANEAAHSPRQVPTMAWNRN